MNRPRIIPVLSIDKGKLVKTISFNKPIYIGDPINATKIFNDKEVDELCILDITASKLRNKPDFKLLETIANEAFMPLSYGGGVNSLNDAIKILELGYEKIIFNTIILTNIDLITELIKSIGSQSVVACIDYRRTKKGKYEAYAFSGKKKIKIEIYHLINHLQNIGVGEIILHCIDNDGKMEGYDFDFVKYISSQITVPIVALGGCGNIDDFYSVLNKSYASAAAASSLFIFHGKKKGILINFPTEEELIRKGIFNGQQLL